MLAQFSDIKAHDMGEIREEVSMLQMEIHPLSKTNILAILPVVPLII